LYAVVVFGVETDTRFTDRLTVRSLGDLFIINEHSNGGSSVDLWTIFGKRA
jgi:hypothetical protein